jgi:hypothetical protein
MIDNTKVRYFDNNATTQAATALQINQLHAASLAVTTAALEQPEGWLPCDVNDLDPSCVEGFLIDFVERAFRRPTTADEQAFVQDFYDEMLALDGDPRAALQLTLHGLLLSPDLLYVVEFCLVITFLAYLQFASCVAILDLSPALCLMRMRIWIIN